MYPLGVISMCVVHCFLFSEDGETEYMCARPIRPTASYSGFPQRLAAPCSALQQSGHAGLAK